MRQKILCVLVVLFSYSALCEDILTAGLETEVRNFVPGILKAFAGNDRSQQIQNLNIIGRYLTRFLWEHQRLPFGVTFLI